MIERLYGENTPAETRKESFDAVDAIKRQGQILELLECEHYTAKEMAVILYNTKKIPYPERNYVSPRLTELMQKGMVEPIGKKRCAYTGKMVTVWARRLNE